MKKYLLGIIAIIVAISLNAFTTDHKAVKQTQSTSALIWYAVDGSNEVDPGMPINPGNPLTSTGFQEENPNVCVGDEVPCVRGFSPGSLPTTGTESGIEDILKD